MARKALMLAVGVVALALVWKFVLAGDDTGGVEVDKIEMEHEAET